MDRAGTCVGFLVDAKARARNREGWCTHLCSLGTEGLAMSPHPDKIKGTTRSAPPRTKDRTSSRDTASGTQPVHWGVQTVLLSLGPRTALACPSAVSQFLSICPLPSPPPSRQARAGDPSRHQRQPTW